MDLLHSIQKTNSVIQFVSEYHDNMLLMSTKNTLDNTMEKVLESFGRAASVDRMHVWKNHEEEDGRLHTSQIFG